MKKILTLLIVISSLFAAPQLYYMPNQTLGITQTPVEIIALDAGATIPAGTSMVLPNSSTANAWFTLPALVTGHVVTLLIDAGATGYEVRPAIPIQCINAVSCTPNLELAVAADTLVRFTCISSLGWIAEKVSTAGVMATAGTPDS